MALSDFSELVEHLLSPEKELNWLSWCIFVSNRDKKNQKRQSFVDYYRLVFMVQQLFEYYYVFFSSKDTR